MREQTAASQTDHQHEELRDYETCEECVSHLRIFGEQFRTGLQTLDNQTAHEHSGYRFTGYAAVTDSPGMPNVSVGIRDPPVTALLAASEAATPSIEPLPNSSFRLENFLAVSYPRKQAIDAPAPGRIPMMFPMIQERIT